MPRCKSYPVAKRIELFKTIVFVYKYFTMHHVILLITPYQANRSGLNSSNDTRLLTRPKSFLCFTNKGFYAPAPKLWNNLPRHVRHASSLLQFISGLRLTYSNLLLLVLCIFLFFHSGVIHFCVRALYKYLHYLNNKLLS